MLTRFVRASIYWSREQSGPVTRDGSKLGDDGEGRKSL
jgi:hypothetical protein